MLGARYVAADVLQTHNVQNNTDVHQSLDEPHRLSQMLTSDALKESNVTLTLDNVDEEDTVEELVFFALYFLSL